MSGPGSLCWVELAVVDVSSAKRFYGELLGWSMRDVPMPSGGGGGTYTIFQVLGKDVGGLHAVREEHKRSGTPAHWSSYVAVEDADAVVKKAESLGGEAILRPLDLQGVGRVAALQDPTGGKISILAPAPTAKGEGGGYDNKPGAFCWAELLTTNVDRAGSFYANLFGWRPEASEVGGTKYTMFHIGDRPAAGMLAMPSDAGALPSQWLDYFVVSDTDAAVKKAAAAKAKIRREPSDIPKVGRFSVLEDPQGALFAIIKLAM